MIGSKWKLLIMRNLLQRPWRFNELKKDLEGDQPKGVDGQPALDGSRWYHYPYRLSRSTAEGGIRPLRPRRIHASPLWMQWRFGGRNIKNRRNKKHQACRSNSTGLMFSCFLYHSQKSGSGRWADANQKPRYSTGAARGNNFPARGAAVPFHRSFPFVSATLAYQAALSLGVRLPVA